MTTESGLRWLTGVIRDIPRRIPILLWGSIPCTGGSRWVRFNLKQYPTTFPARLRMLRAQWRRMFTNFTKVWDIIAKRGGYWSIEWPDGNAYWNNPLVLDFLAKVGSPIYQAIVAGCAYNLRALYGQEAGQLMGRAWLIKGNIDLIPQMLEKPCSCPKGTEHAVATGSNTEVTGKYTEAFVRTVHSMFSITAARYRQKRV